MSEHTRRRILDQLESLARQFGQARDCPSATYSRPNSCSKLSKPNKSKAVIVCIPR